MRLVIQRVLESSVSVDGTVTGAGGAGLLVLVGVETGDSTDDARWLAAKTAALRIFARPGSESDVMDASVTDIASSHSRRVRAKVTVRRTYVRQKAKRPARSTKLTAESLKGLPGKP